VDDLEIQNHGKIWTDMENLYKYFLPSESVLPLFTYKFKINEGILDSVRKLL